MESLLAQFPQRLSAVLRCTSGSVKYKNWIATRQLSHLSAYKTNCNSIQVSSEPSSNFIITQLTLNNIGLPSIHGLGRPVGLGVNFSTMIHDNQKLDPSEEESEEESTENNHELQEIVNKMNPDDAKKFKILQLEYDVFFSTDVRVPSRMTTDMWLHVFNKCPTVSSRRKIYKFWFKREMIREAEKKKKEARRLERGPKPPKDMSEPCANRIFPHYTKSRINQQFFAPNMAFAMVHGPHLVFDLAFENQMQEREIKNLVDQIVDSHGYNHSRSDPFHFHFCNVDPNSKMCEILYQRFLGLREMLYTVTDKSYMDLYPKENLIYLSPNAPTLMKEYDHHATYILGGIVDKSIQDPLTFAKSKRDQIRSVKLPLDKYVDWVQGSKALTLDQMVKILKTLKDENNNWYKALKHLPKRKFNWR